MGVHDKSGYAGRVLRAGRTPPARPAAAEPEPTRENRHAAEAARIIAQAESQAKAILSRAEGLAQRLREETEARVRAECEARLAAELLGFHRRLRQELDEIRPMLVRMVVDGVEGIIGSIPQAVLSEKLILRGMRELQDHKAVVVHTAPKDFATLRRAVDALMRAGESTLTAVHADSDLAPGTCRLEAGGISIEIGLAAQLATLEAILLREGGEKVPPADPQKAGEP